MLRNPTCYCQAVYRNRLAFHWLLALMAVAAALPPSISSACPFCDSEVGIEVSARIFNGQFIATMAAVVAPFPVLAMVVAAIYGGFPCLRGDRQGRQAEER